MLHFVLGRVKSGKTSYLIDKIRSRREEGTLFLVPEPYSHSMERLLCEMCGNTVSSYAEVTSFRRLATRVKSENGGIAAETVGGGRRILLLHSALSAVSPSLKMLGKAAHRPERLSEILSAIDEFKAYGVSPENVAKVAVDVSENLAKKLSDLAMIYAAYESELSEDEFDAYDELMYVAKSLKENDFLHNKTLYLDGFTGFTSAQFDIIEAAIYKARDVYVALELPEEEDTGSENGIFDKAFETQKRIEELAKRRGVEFDEVYLSQKGVGALHHLDSALFSDEVKKFDGEASEITLARGEGIFEECELAAAYILDRVRDGARFRDFSVAVTDESEYLGICESVFSRYGIPVYMSTAHDITEKPPVALILSAFDCILRGFRTDAVMGYLKTGFSGVCAKSLDVFENYLYTWAPKPSAWSSGKDFTQNPMGLTAEETEQSRSLLRTVNCVRKKIYEPITKLSAALKRGKTGEACAEALYEFIKDINLPRRCIAYAYLAETTGRLSDAQEYRSLIKILCDAIDSIGHATLEQEIDAGELYMLFKIVVSQYELGTIPASLDCVSVGGFDRADGERCRARIILGANEGVFPKSSDNGGILSDNDRAELADFRIELAPAMSDRIFEEYRTIHSIICSAERELYISSAALGKDGEEKNESPIVSRIRSTFDVVSDGLTLRQARLRAKVPCFDESIVAKSLRDYWENDEEYETKLRTAEINSRGKRGPIFERENIEAIFGEKIRLSASRADLFSSCRYAYFLKYGMNARSRERAEISPIEAGSLMHYVLEKVISALSDNGSYDIGTALALAEEACREYVAMTLKGSDKLSGRMEFLIGRLQKTVKAAVEDICRELSKSEFVPLEFELKFTGGEDALPPLEIHGEQATVLLRGAVDRVDAYELDGEMYFRIIDYKSGKKEFSLDEAINGVGMQMLLYMFALEEMGAGRYGKKPCSAGVMYVPIARELARGRGETAREARREGVVLRDMRIIHAMEKGDDKVYIPVSLDKHGGIKKGSVVLTKHEFQAVKDRMKQVLAKIGDELYRGEIEPNPYINKTSSSCDWCEYKSICAFDEARSCDSKRELIDISFRDMLKDLGGEEDEPSKMDS